MQKLLLRYPDHPVCFLKIAEGGFFDHPTAVSTVLGSCVAVTFYCRRTGTGATFHAVLPRWRSHEKTKRVSLPFRYVDSAIDAILEGFTKRSIKLSELEVKVFGGASLLLEGELNAGRTNVEVALQTLADNGLRVLKTDVGGLRGRRLLFISNTGDVYIKLHRQLKD